MKTLQLLVLLLLPTFLLAQGPVFEKVQTAKVKANLTEYNVVNPVSTDVKSASVPEGELTKGVIVDLDVATINTLRQQQPDQLQMSFPTADQTELQVELVKNNIFTPDFSLRTSSAPNQVANYTPGLYYQGVLSNDPNSLVAISIFENEIIGMINTNEGNYVIGKLKKGNADKHIIYFDQDLVIPVDFSCEMPDDGVVYTREELTVSGARDVGDCIRVYIEIDDDIVTQKGGVTPATNYVTGLFNESITLYANESLAMSISEIKAWDTPAPYSGSSSSAMLNSYQANTGAFNGDLSHLVSYQASGGIAAGFSGICNSNVDNSKCFSSINSTYSNVPVYSFSVMVVTHEMGHLIGSRHTHACVWNGNGTAIDGCAGGTEGSCSVPGSPSGGGTIMSYCHLTTGIDFTQGFGPQPGNVIRNTVANATCLSPCGGGDPTCTDGIQNGNETGVDCGGPDCPACPTCDDGVQNGNETGVDCGGPDCPACPTGCNENDLFITINLDNYPEETSWEVTNASGTVVGSGGTYGSQPDGSTVTENLCLIDGCYDFTIFDSYGDGICCGYGNGSYTVTDGSGNVLASGGSFGNSETTNFCLGDPPAPTCDDGIQNGDETGVDCGGPDCPPCDPGGEILGSYFETGWDGWADGGSDCARYSGSRSYEGSYSIRIRDNSGVASSMTSPVLDVSSYSQLELTFYFYPNSMETGEDFWVRYYDGSSWTTIAAYASGTSFNNNSFYVATVTINSAQYTFPTNAQFRFQCDASGNADRVYIDAVTINASSSSLSDEGTVVTIEELNTINPGGMDLQTPAKDQIDGVAVYPNPATEVINVNANLDIQSIQVISLAGQVIKTIQANSTYEELDISTLEPGVYYLLIQVDGEVIPQKFVKM